MHVKLAWMVQVMVTMAVGNKGERQEWKGVSVMGGGVMVGWVADVEQREDSAEPPLQSKDLLRLCTTLTLFPPPPPPLWGCLGVGGKADGGPEMMGTEGCQDLKCLLLWDYTSYKDKKHNLCTCLIW